METIRKGPVEISLNSKFNAVSIKLTYPISRSFIQDSFLDMEAFEIDLNCMRGKFFRLRTRWYYTTSILVEENFDKAQKYIVDELIRIKHMTGCHKRIGPKYWDKSLLMLCYHCALNEKV